MSESALYQAKKYLHLVDENFWRWSIEGDAVKWKDDQTIAYAEELHRIFEKQTSNRTRGLPPFGAFLLLIAATRDCWDSTHRVWLRTQLTSVVDSHRILDNVEPLLDRVAALPKEDRYPHEANVALAELAFAAAQRTSVEVADEVLRLLSSGVGEINDEPIFGLGAGVKKEITFDLHTLRIGLQNFDENNLRLLRKTGLEQLPEAEKAVELPDDLSPQELIAELETDRELYVLARAARQYFSVLSLPQPSFQVSDLEQGGVSDIANRGPLDRLLLSELAHDDLTLAVRVAVNEAMYLRRESPPSNTQIRRMVVLDSGLRSWGQPRLLGTAMGLALVAKSDHHARQDQPTQTEVFSACGDSIQPVTLSNREGIVSHLKTLRHELDLSDSLPAIEQNLKDAESACDLVLITNESTAHSEAFATRLNQTDLLSHPKLSRLFLGSVNREGQTELIEVNQKGRRLVKELTLDLKRLSQPPKTNKSRTTNHFPSFLCLDSMPLLLSYAPAKPNFVWPIGLKKIIVLADDGRLLYFTDQQFGGEQVSDSIRPAQVWWFSIRPQAGVWFAIIGHPDRRDFRLLSFDETTKKATEVPLDLSDRPKGFCSHQASLFVVYRNRVVMINRASGQESEELKTPEYFWQSGRFFSSTGHERHYYAIASDGSKPKLERVPVPITGSIHQSQSQFLFETECVEGPVAVYPFPKGEVHFAGNGKIVKLYSGRNLVDQDSRVVRDFCPFTGMLLMGPANSPWSQEVDIFTGISGEARTRKNFVARQLKSLASSQQLRSRFFRARITDDGSFQLASKNEFQLEFKMRHGQIVFENRPVDQRTPATERSSLEVRLDDVQNQIGKRYSLKVARWEDGSEAWLDSRGLVHLRSSDLSIPELTITLCHGSCAAWCSDGDVFGWDFFTGDVNLSRTEEVIEILKRFGEHVVKSCQ